MRQIIALAYLMDESLGERPFPSKYSPTCRGCGIRSKLAGWISEGDGNVVGIGIEIDPTLLFDGVATQNRGDAARALDFEVVLFEHSTIAPARLSLPRMTCGRNDSANDK
jgi:hypothetical protein